MSIPRMAVVAALTTGVLALTASPASAAPVLASMAAPYKVGVIQCGAYTCHFDDDDDWDDDWDDYYDDADNVCGPSITIYVEAKHHTIVFHDSDCR